MIRSILNRSILAATCVLAMGQTVNAAVNLNAGDPALVETAAGQAFQQQKASGETCPYASKVELNVSTAANNSITASAGASSFTGSGTIRR